MTLLTPFACAALLAAQAPSTPPAPTSVEPRFLPIQAGGLPEAMHGIWQARGYGLVAQLGPTSRLFDHSPAGTLEQELDLDGFLVGLHYAFEGDRLLLTGIPGSSTIYAWDRLEALPSACSAAPLSDDPLSCFDYFWEVMDHHYPYFELRGVDWEARRTKHRPRVGPETTQDELWTILCDMLSGFGDAHLFLSGEVDGVEQDFDENTCRELDPALEAGFAAQDRIDDLGSYRRWWTRDYGERIRRLLLREGHEIAGRGQVTWGRIGWLGYINVRGMGGFAPGDDVAADVAATHEVMSEILTALEDTDGIILDITLNTGGYEEVQMALSSHFVDEPRPAFSKRALDVADPRPQAFHLFPADGVRYLGPVSLVTSDFTVSAGEDFTLAMRELPHVTHRGTRTRGSFSDILEKRLPNGWLLSLSNEAYLDVEGNNLEAIGVEPEVHVPIFVAGSVETSHVDAILAIADMMNAGD